MSQIPEDLQHHTKIHGKVNGREFELVGQGSGRPYDGKLESHLSSTRGPLHFPMHLLDIVSIFGYPTYSKYHAGTKDLFKISDGYEYERNLTYENGGFMKTLHIITRQEDGLHGDFQVVDAQVECPELEGIEPISETFIPAGPGKIKSEAVIAWRTVGGGLFTATCKSEYRLKHNECLPYLHFRLVDFTTNHTQENLNQEESLNVLRCFQPSLKA